MDDSHTTLGQLRRRVAEFVAARDWEVFHTPQNLSAAIAVEAAELMEQFLWRNETEAPAAPDEPERRAAVIDELADVLIYVLSMANVMEVDMSSAIVDKLERNERRFPAEQWRGQAWLEGRDDTP
jgi:NTP pyrophosphatase (non-canonical NTP hydrolase)